MTCTGREPMTYHMKKIFLQSIINHYFIGDPLNKKVLKWDAVPHIFQWKPQRTRKRRSLPTKRNAVATSACSLPNSIDIGAEVELDNNVQGKMYIYSYKEPVLTRISKINL